MNLIDPRRYPEDYWALEAAVDPICDWCLRPSADCTCDERMSPWYSSDVDYVVWLDYWRREAADLWDWAVQLPAEELSAVDASMVLRMLREAKLLDDVPPGSDAETVLAREFSRHLGVVDG